MYTGTCTCISSIFIMKYFIIGASACDFQQCGMCDQQSLRSACAYAQSDQSLCLLLEYSMTVKLLTEDHLESLHLKGGCTGSSESTLVQMPHCWKSCHGSLDYGYTIIHQFSIKHQLEMLIILLTNPSLPKLVGNQPIYTVCKLK